MQNVLTNYKLLFLSYFLKKMDYKNILTDIDDKDHTGYKHWVGQLQKMIIVHTSQFYQQS